MTRSQWQTLAELDEILNKAARLTDTSYSINLPHDKGGNLSMNESIELFKKEKSQPIFLRNKLAKFRLRNLKVINRERSE